MNAGIVSLIVFVVVMAGVFVGTALQRVLPKHHLSDDSKDMVKIGAGFIATLAALVLGLLVASATASFNAKFDEVERSAAKMIAGGERPLRALRVGRDLLIVEIHSAG